MTITSIEPERRAFLDWAASPIFQGQGLRLVPVPTWSWVAAFLFSWFHMCFYRILLTSLWIYPIRRLCSKCSKTVTVLLSVLFPPRSLPSLSLRLSRPCTPRAWPCVTQFCLLLWFRGPPHFPPLCLVILGLTPWHSAYFPTFPEVLLGMKAVSGVYLEMPMRVLKMIPCKRLTRIKGCS